MLRGELNLAKFFWGQRIEFSLGFDCDRKSRTHL